MNLSSQCKDDGDGSPPISFDTNSCTFLGYKEGRDRPHDTRRTSTAHNLHDAIMAMKVFLNFGEI